jgi:hypothetical protein
MSAEQPLAERHCMVLQTIRHVPETTISRSQRPRQRNRVELQTV